MNYFYCLTFFDLKSYNYVLLTIKKQKMTYEICTKIP